MDLFNREDYEDWVYQCKNLVLANKIIFTTILVMLVLMPIAIRIHYVDLISPILTSPEFRSGRHGEISSWFPFLLLMGGTAVLLICFLYQLNNGYAFAKTKWNHWVLALLVVVPFTALFAWNKSTALFGFYENREGVLVYCSYFFIFFLVLHQTWFPKQLVKMWLALIPFLVINLLLGLLIVFNVDILNHSIVYWFLGMDSPFPEGTLLRTTAYNPNFTSGIAGTLYVLFLLLMLMHSKRAVRMASFVTALVCFLLVCTSLSFSGFLLVFAFSPVLLIFALIKQKRLWKRTLSSFLVLLVAMTIFYIPLTMQNARVWQESFGNLIRIAAIFKGSSAETVLPPGEDAILPELPEAGVSALSGRKYIWDKTIEVWLQSPIFGTGLETIQYYIDEDDINKIARLGSYDAVIGKPHSLYLGWLYGGGIVLFLVLFSFFTALCLGLLIRIWKGSNNVILLATGAAMVAYLVQGLVNDSRIATSIIFWVITGVFASELLTEVRGGRAELKTKESN